MVVYSEVVPHNIIKTELPYSIYSRRNGNKLKYEHSPSVKTRQQIKATKQKMVREDNTYVLYGPKPHDPVIPKTTLGQEIYDRLITNDCSYEALVDGFTGKQISYQQLLQDACNLAEALKISGYGKGTICSISSENNIQFFIPIIACLLNGCIMAPLNHLYSPTELRHTLNITKPKVIFCSQNIANKYIELKKELNFIERIIIIDTCDQIDGSVSLNGFMELTLKGRTILPYKFIPFNEEPSKTPAFIMCSSGTTGLPKGVMLSHTNIMIRVLHTRDPRYKYLEDKRTTVLGLLPFFHSFGLVTSLTAIISKHRIVVFHKFDDDIFLNSIGKYKISILLLAPPLAIFFAKSDKLKQYDMSSIKSVSCGAAPLSKETEIEVKRRLKVDNVKQGYGLTETTLGVIITGECEKQKAGSCGKVVTFMSAKIRDPETGKSLCPYEVGEICVKGPMVMLGYYNNEKATKETFTSDGWLKTGDLGYYDDEDYFYIVDRLKELIKYKGYQVAPAELESLLINHPKVKDAGVVGFPDETCGELPVAFVVKKEGQEVTEEELQKYVEGQVSPQKYLRGGIIFSESIPKNPSGKILRRQLRLMLKDHKPKLESKL